MSFPALPRAAGLGRLVHWSVVAVFAACSALSAEPNLHLAPAAQWSADARPADRVTLSDLGGMLKVQYALAGGEEYQFGNETVRQAVVALRLKTPVKLAADQARIVFEATGILQPYSRAADSVNLYPVIRDSNGELLRYTPYPEPPLDQSPLWHIDPGLWRRWMTRYFYTSEAGGAAIDIYDAFGGDRNAWPDGQLEFVGFDLIARSRLEKPFAGAILIKDLAAGPRDLPELRPYLYASPLLREKGRYRLAYEVANQFQGPPVRAETVGIDFDPDDPASRSRRIALRLGPADNYWVRYLVTRADGSAVANGTFRWQCEADLDPLPAKPPAATDPPVVGLMRINSDAHTTGVYRRDEPLVVTVRAFRREGAEPATVRWRLLEYNQGLVHKAFYDTQLAAGTAPITPPEQSAAFTDVPIRLTPRDGVDAYRLEIKLADAAETVLDSRMYLLGRRSDLDTPYTSRQGSLPDRQALKRFAYVHTTFHHPSYAMPKSLAEDLEKFAQYVREASHQSHTLHVIVDVRDVEPLPGVYDFSLLDRYLDIAADYGCRATVGFRHYDAQGTYNWQKYTRQRNFDNIEVNQHNTLVQDNPGTA